MSFAIIAMDHALSHIVLQVVTYIYTRIACNTGRNAVVLQSASRSMPFVLVVNLESRRRQPVDGRHHEPRVQHARRSRLAPDLRQRVVFGRLVRATNSEEQAIAENAVKGRLHPVQAPSYRSGSIASSSISTHVRRKLHHGGWW